jgi:hypothetical protein
MDREKWMVKMIKCMEENLLLLRDSFANFAIWVTQQDANTVNAMNEMRSRWKMVDEHVSSGGKDEDDYYERVFFKQQGK